MPGKYFGKYRGTVVDNHDPENRGRVKVNVPNIQDDQAQIYAEPALPFGFFFVPETGADVWVEFEGGDPGLPIWSGAIYVAGKWPQEANADPPQNRVIKTVAGHLVSFHDKQGDERIEIKDGVNGHTITLDKNGIKVQDGKNNQTLTFASGGVTVESASSVKAAVSAVKLEITSSGVTVDAGASTVTIKGLGGINLGQATALVARMGDMGTGNLGAPVPITTILPTNINVKA